MNDSIEREAEPSPIGNMDDSPVKIYALGGLGEIGKNCYCVENDSDLIILDSGVMFPDYTTPGVNYIIPDFTHLKENERKIRALLITHGHEDHIGSIPFLLQTVKVPVIYAPRLACALIRHKLEEYNLTSATSIVEVDEHSDVRCGSFRAQFFHVTHSIPDAFGIYVTTPQGTLATRRGHRPADGRFDQRRARGLHPLRAERQARYRRCLLSGDGPHHYLDLRLQPLPYHSDRSVGFLSRAQALRHGPLDGG